MTDYDIGNNEMEFVQVNLNLIKRTWMKPVNLCLTDLQHTQERNNINEKLYDWVLIQTQDTKLAAPNYNLIHTNEENIS